MTLVDEQQKVRPSFDDPRWRPISIARARKLGRERERRTDLIARRDSLTQKEKRELDVLMQSPRVWLQVDLGGGYRGRDRYFELPVERRSSDV